jgi:hypothetical protein
VIALEKYKRTQYKAHLDEITTEGPRIVGYIAWDAYLQNCHHPSKWFAGSSPEPGSHCDLRINIRMIAGRGHGMSLWRVLLRWVALTVPRLDVKVEEISVTLQSVRGPRELKFYEKIGFHVSSKVVGFGDHTKPTTFKPLLGGELIKLERDLPVPEA